MSDTPPFLLVFAGPNGSGKSALVAHLLRAGYDLGDHINPDDIAAQLQGSYEERVRKAQVIADIRRAEALVARQSFSFESVFSHPSKLDVMHQARDRGFTVTLFFIALDSPEKNVLRVRTRVQSGGHRAYRVAVMMCRGIGLLLAMRGLSVCFRRWSRPHIVPISLTILLCTGDRTGQGGSWHTPSSMDRLSLRSRRKSQPGSTNTL